MTDLLLKPEDTGDIPRTDAVGEGTRNLAPYVRNLPPTQVLRRANATGEIPLYVPAGLINNEPTAVLALIGGCRTVVPNDEDFVRPGQPGYPNPDPLPPPPPPKPSDVWEAAPAARHIGRHRRPSRWDWLTVPLAMAWQRIVGAV